MNSSPPPSDMPDLILPPLQPEARRPGHELRIKSLEDRLRNVEQALICSIQTIHLLQNQLYLHSPLKAIHVERVKATVRPPCE